MPDPKQLKVGDRVKFVSLPEEWSQPGFRVWRETLLFMKRMIKRSFSSRVVKVDDYGYPWIKARLLTRGKIHYHSYGIYDSTGWRIVQPRSRKRSTLADSNN